MNRRGKAGESFAFLIDFDFQEPRLFELESSSGEILWQTPIHQNFQEKEIENVPFRWDVESVPEELYSDAFCNVQKEIHNGNTYLLNLTFPSKVSTDLQLEEIFHRSSALYKIFLKDRFVCFSPEIFVRINDGIISSYPMKGTIDATISGAEENPEGRSQGTGRTQYNCRSDTQRHEPGGRKCLR